LNSWEISLKEKFYLEPTNKEMSQLFFCGEIRVLFAGREMFGNEASSRFQKPPCRFPVSKGELGAGNKGGCSLKIK